MIPEEGSSLSPKKTSCSLPGRRSLCCGHGLHGDWTLHSELCDAEISCPRRFQLSDGDTDEMK